MHASYESPWHSLAKHHLLGACFPRMVPFRSMLLTLQSGLKSSAPRARRVPVYPMVFSTFLYRAFTAHVMIAIPGVLIGGIARGPAPQEAVVREWLPSNHQPFLGSRTFALDPRLHPAPDYLNLHWPFFPIAHRHVRPRLRIEVSAPLRHRLPRVFRATATPGLHGQRGLSIPNRRGAGHPQPIPLAPLP